jgi:hypothetical protein
MSLVSGGCEDGLEVGGKLDPAVTSPNDDSGDGAVEGLELGDFSTEEEGGRESPEGDNRVL